MRKVRKMAREISSQSCICGGAVAFKYSIGSYNILKCLRCTLVFVQGNHYNPENYEEEYSSRQWPWVL